MRHGIAIAVMAVVATAGGAFAARQAASTERELYAVEEAWARALVARDAVAFDQLIASGWVYTDERGTIDKRAAIREFTKGADTVTAAGNEGMRARVYGSTAVVTGILWTKGRANGTAFAHRYRYTDTWMRLDGRWQCIASQDYDMPKG